VRRQFIEAYAARTPLQSIRQIAGILEITEPTLRKWMRDQSFRDELHDQDLPRIEMAREVARRSITAVVEAQARIAHGSTMAAGRAALFLANVAGLTVPPATQVNVNTTVENQVNARDVATIMREMEEVDALLAEHERNAEKPD
jgi:filamentous hemagglutinin family protein